MQQPQIDAIKASPAYRRLVASRRRFSFAMTALMILTYYGFILFVALSPQTLARPLHAGATATAGVLAGVGIIFVAIGLTGWYVWRANRTLDPLMHTLLQQAHQKG